MLRASSISKGISSYTKARKNVSRKRLKRPGGTWSSAALASPPPQKLPNLRRSLFKKPKSAADLGGEALRLSLLRKSPKLILANGCFSCGPVFCSTNSGAALTCQHRPRLQCQVVNRSLSKALGCNDTCNMACCLRGAAQMQHSFYCIS